MRGVIDIKHKESMNAFTTDSANSTKHCRREAIEQGKSKRQRYSSVREHCISSGKRVQEYVVGIKNEGGGGKEKSKLAQRANMEHFTPMVIPAIVFNFIHPFS